MAEATERINQRKGKSVSGYMSSIAESLRVLSIKDIKKLSAAWAKESNPIKGSDSPNRVSFAPLSSSSLGIAPNPYSPFNFVHGIIHAKPPTYFAEREIHFIATIERSGTRAEGATSSYIHEEWINIYSPSSIEPYTIPRDSETYAIGLLDEGGRLLAEATVLSVNSDMRTFRVLEVHYTTEGELKPIFTCESTYSLVEGFKLSESYVVGEKGKDFYFIWPVGQMPVRWPG